MIPSPHALLCSVVSLSVCPSLPHCLSLALSCVPLFLLCVRPLHSHESCSASVFSDEAHSGRQREKEQTSGSGSRRPSREHGTRRHGRTSGTRSSCGHSRRSSHRSAGPGLQPSVQSHCVALACGLRSCSSGLRLRVSCALLLCLRVCVARGLHAVRLVPAGISTRHAHTSSEHCAGGIDGLRGPLGLCLAPCVCVCVVLLFRLRAVRAVHRGLSDDASSCDSSVHGKQRTVQAGQLPHARGAGSGLNKQKNQKLNTTPRAPSASSSKSSSSSSSSLGSRGLWPSWSQPGSSPLIHRDRIIPNRTDR